MNEDRLRILRSEEAAMADLMNHYRELHLRASKALFGIRAELDALTSTDVSVELMLDEDDARSLTKAVSIREKMACIPDGGGNEAGRTVAEICRGWMEMLDAAGVRRDSAK